MGWSLGRRFALFAGIGAVAGAGFGQPAALSLVDPGSGLGEVSYPAMIYRGPRLRLLVPPQSDADSVLMRRTHGAIDGPERAFPVIAGEVFLDRVQDGAYELWIVASGKDRWWRRLVVETGEGPRLPDLEPLERSLLVPIRPGTPVLQDSPEPDEMALLATFRSDPKAPTAFRLGVLATERGRLPLALARHEAALALDPEFVPSLGSWCQLACDPANRALFPHEADQLVTRLRLLVAILPEGTTEAAWAAGASRRLGRLADEIRVNHAPRSAAWFFAEERPDGPIATSPSPVSRHGANRPMRLPTLPDQARSQPAAGEQSHGWQDSWDRISQTLWPDRR